MRILHVPKGSPYLNPVEAYRRRGRRDLPVSEYCETFGTMCGVTSEYHGTTRFGPDLYAYLYRSPSTILANLRS